MPSPVLQAGKGLGLIVALEHRLNVSEWVSTGLWRRAHSGAADMQQLLAGIGTGSPPVSIPPYAPLYIGSY
jgi:hypothetical protein